MTTTVPTPLTTTLLRRLAGPASLLIAGVLALAGCTTAATPGSGTVNAAASPSASPSAATGNGLLPAGEGTTTYPLTLKSPWGETVLEQRPERIAVVTGANDLDNTLALGVTPVWADDYQSTFEWTKKATTKKIEKLGEVTDVIPVEDIATSEPDLIIAIQTDAGILEDSYAKLAEIAPVLTAEKPSWDVTWQDTVKLIGSTLDLTQRADQVITDVDTKISAAAAANPAFQGKSLSFILWLQGNEKLTYRSFAGSSSSELFTELGFTAPANAAKFSRDNLFLSAENYGLIDADVVLIASPKKQFTKLLATPTFAKVPAIAEQRYALLDLDVETELGWAVAWPSALSLPWLVDKITPPLAKKLG